MEPGISSPWRLVLISPSKVEAPPDQISRWKRSDQNRTRKRPWVATAVESKPPWCGRVKAGISNCIESEISKIICQRNSILLEQRPRICTDFGSSYPQRSNGTISCASADHGSVATGEVCQRFAGNLTLQIAHTGSPLWRYGLKCRIPGSLPGFLSNYQCKYRAMPSSRPLNNKLCF